MALLQLPQVQRIRTTNKKIPGTVDDVMDKHSILALAFSGCVPEGESLEASFGSEIASFQNKGAEKPTGLVEYSHTQFLIWFLEDMREAISSIFK